MAAFFAGEEDLGQMIKQPPSPPNAPSESAAVPAKKKKRNLPGYPKDPDAEVIALSPRTLMATNRFVCEVCNKGFQREQNLQLHRRGHNLPWKLKQKSTKEVRRKVYLCPEPTCAHHDPLRALGDLTGIKKHFCRKHGEKKWKCDKCAKRYAVQSDWKAHSKTCGTREYRCDCGTIFSRRDSFITHRAFCDALAQDSERLPPNLASLSSHLYGTGDRPANSNITGLGLSYLHDAAHPQFDPLRSSAAAFYSAAPADFTAAGPMQLLPDPQPFNASSHLTTCDPFEGETSLYPIPPQMSATALLQKAALMGATTRDGSGGSFALTSSSGGLQDLLMSSLAGGNAGVFGPSVGIGTGTGTDGLTRDFLGLRGMVNGTGRHNGGIDVGALESERAAGSSYSGLQ